MCLIGVLRTLVWARLHKEILTAAHANGPKRQRAAQPYRSRPTAIRLLGLGYVDTTITSTSPSTRAATATTRYIDMYSYTLVR